MKPSTHRPQINGPKISAMVTYGFLKRSCSLLSSRYEVPGDRYTYHEGNRKIIGQRHVLARQAQAIGQRVARYLKKPGARIIDTAKLRALTHGLDENILQQFLGIFEMAEPMTQITAQFGLTRRPRRHQAGHGHQSLSALKKRLRNHSETLTSAIITGTSTNGPMTAAKAAPELMP